MAKKSFLIFFGVILTSLSLNLFGSTPPQGAAKQPIKKSDTTTPSSSSADSARVTSDVRDAVKLAFPNYSLSIHVFNGLAVISGVVDTTSDSKSIESTVKGVKGVVSIQNRLLVRKPTAAPTPTPKPKPNRKKTNF